MELLNTNLKWLRNAFSFSLKDLSKHLDIKISTLNSYEDNTFPRIDTLQRLVNWYAQAIPALTIDDVVNFKLEEKYGDSSFNHFDEIKSSDGYQTSRNAANYTSENQSEIELSKLDVFNSIITLAGDQNMNPEIIKELLLTFNLNFKK